MKVRVCTGSRVEGIGGIGFTWLPEPCITYLWKNLCREIIIRRLNQAGSIGEFRVQGIAAFYPREFPWGSAVRVWGSGFRGLPGCLQRIFESYKGRT